MSCCNNAMAVGRATPNGMNSMSCSASTCADGGGRCSGVGPRPKREKTRLQIRDFILNMLGAPALELELDEQNLDFCIDRAMRIFEDYCGREYYTYYTFFTTPGKTIYEMPPDVGIVRDVEYQPFGNMAYMNTDLQGAVPVEYSYPGSNYSGMMGGFINTLQPMWGQMSEWALFKQYEQMYNNLSGTIGTWEWISDMRHIKLFPAPVRPTMVGVRYLQKCKDWEEVTQAMEEGALAQAKQILGRIRSKFKNLPGGVQLDGEALLQEGMEEWKQWKEDLLNKFGDVITIQVG